MPSVTTLKDQGFYDKWARFGDALGKLVHGDPSRTIANQQVEMNQLGIEKAQREKAQAKRDEFFESFDPAKDFRSRFLPGVQLPDLDDFQTWNDEHKMALQNVYQVAAQKQGVRPPSETELLQHYAGTRMARRDPMGTQLPDLPEGLQITGMKVGADGSRSYDVGAQAASGIAPALNADGTVNPAWIQVDGKYQRNPDYRPPMSMKERLEWMGQFESLKMLEDDVATALKIAQDPDVNVVGAEITGGSKIGAGFRGIVDLLFGMTQDTQDQNVFHRLSSNRVLEVAKYLTGPKSDNDIKFLERSQVKVTDDEATWLPYLQAWQRLIRNEKDYREALLVGEEEQYVKSMEDGTEYVPPSRRNGQQQPSAPGALPDVDPSGVQEPGSAVPGLNPQNLTSNEQARFPDLQSAQQAIASGAVQLQPGQGVWVLNPTTGQYEEYALDVPQLPLASVPTVNAPTLQ